MNRDLLRDAGEALYGPRWQSELARDLDMSERHMRRLVAGSADLTAGMIEDLWSICEDRAGRLNSVMHRLKTAAPLG